MANVSSSSSSSGIGFVGLLTILFVALKLCKVITWSWLWVLSPLWGGFSLAIMAIVVALAVINYHDRPKKRGGK